MRKSLILLRMTNYVLALEKCKKECNILLIVLVQGVCPLKFKITQFTELVDSILKVSVCHLVMT